MSKVYFFAFTSTLSEKVGVTVTSWFVSTVMSAATVMVGATLSMLSTVRVVTSETLPAASLPRNST